MKKLLQTKFFIAIIFLLILNSYSFSQLNGTYTIGSGGNYPTISSAVSDLVADGVNGPVIFNIKTGNYNEQIAIDSVGGVDSINTVTFQSASGNASYVNLYHKSMTSDYLIKFEGADFIRFQNVTFIDSLSIDYRSIVRISSNSSDISFINNVFVSYMGIFFKTSAYTIFGSGNHMIIRGNTFSGAEVGYYSGVSREGINLSSGSGGCEISNNTFNGFTRCISLENVDFSVIEKNTIYGRGTMYVFSYCIKLNNCNGSRILKNNLNGGYNCGPTSLQGSILQMSNCSNFLIANNFFGLSGCIGISFFSCNNLKFFYNTMAYGGGDQPTNIQVAACDSISLINNIWINSNGFRYGYIYRVSGTISSISSDYNVFYHTLSKFAFYSGTTIPHLSDWQSVTGKDSNSRFRYVTFAFNDLHLAGSSLNDDSLKGIPIKEVTDDYDGDTRDLLRPTMGADEPVYVINITIDLKLLIEGFCDQNAFFQIPDTIRAFLRTTTSPYSIVDSAIAHLSIVGTGYLNFFNAPAGTYYIVVNHRNSIETWSKSGGESLTPGITTPYDFTNSISKAYGNNLILKYFSYCIYSGDVNQDGVIDGSDTQLIDNDAYNFVSGYVNTDTDGNNLVDGSDAIISDNNAFKFVSVIRP